MQTHEEKVRPASNYSSANKMSQPAPEVLEKTTNVFIQHVHPNVLNTHYFLRHYFTADFGFG